MSQVTDFFFQAEDGIRYDLVTGVQTCALPISSVIPKAILPAGAEAGGGGIGGVVVAVVAGAPEAGRRFIIANARSEERRVGKDCKTAWASIKLIQNSAVLDLTEEDFYVMTSNR